jgi:hypothetical protein
VRVVEDGKRVEISFPGALIGGLNVRSESADEGTGGALLFPAEGDQLAQAPGDLVAEAEDLDAKLETLEG